MSIQRILLLLLLAGILMVIGARFIQYEVEQDYIVYSYLPCDSDQESCFVWDCDPAAEEDCDREPYRKVAIPAYNAPHCAYENDCEEFVCDPKLECENLICSDETLEEWEICNNPEMEKEYSDL
jgi:hypothetical protein